MRSRTRRSMSQINVVPYIDVMLVLLVIFMVTAPMIQQGIVDLPSVGKVDREVNKRPIRIEIGSNGLFKLTDHATTETQSDKESLIAAVRSRLSAEPQRPVVIEADKNVRYDIVMQVMDALKQANVARVGLMVQSK